MTRPLLNDEMLERLKNGENPLNLSIEKYERLLTLAEQRIKLDEWWVMSDCCPLCQTYYCGDGYYSEKYPQCPLEIYEEYCGDDDSVWEAVRSSIVHEDNKNIIATIKNMIEKLKYIKERMIEDD